MKKVEVSLFGKLRHIGTVPRPLVTDLISIAEALRRNKLPRLSYERQNAIDTALAQSSEEIKSVSDLRQAIEVWRSERDSEEFDADQHYDSARVASYTGSFSVPQDKHTKRCMYLLNIPSTSTTSLDVCLDVGCGSGLSTQTLLKSFGHVIGIDASSAMLDIARTSNPSGDFIQANFGHRLPFREKSLDHSTSTSAVHYLLNHEERMMTLISELERIVIGGCGWQLFPKGGLDDLLKLAEMIKRVWVDCKIVGDRPHHSSNNSDRWYMSLSRERLRDPHHHQLATITSAVPDQVTPTAPEDDVTNTSDDDVNVCSGLDCPGLDDTGCGLFDHKADCMLMLRRYFRHTDIIDEDHWHWLTNEHRRFKHRLIRVNRRQSSLPASNSHQ